MKQGNHKIYLIALMLLAMTLRFAGINARPIWYDESFSILLSEQGPSAVLSGTLSADADSSAAEEHPPAYYFALWGWMQIFGSSVAAARALSILASLGGIAVIYGIAKHLFDENTALLTAFIASILPFQIHYAQEVRMYSLLAFWLLLTTYAFLKRQWILFAISAALAQYTHNLAAFYLIPLALTPVFQRDWKTLRALTLAGFAALILYFPWLIHLPAQLAKVTSNFWVQKPGAEKIFALLLFYLPHLPLPNIQLMPGLFFAALTIALAGYQTFRAKMNLNERYKGLWLAYLAFTPPLLLWLVSQFSPMYVERALLPSHAMFCIWLAWNFTRTTMPRPLQVVSFAFIVLAAGMGIYQHLAYKDFPYGAYAEINGIARSKLEAGDVIVHSNKLSYLPAHYFDRELNQSFIFDPAGSGTDTLSPATQRILQLTGYKDIESAASNATRVWFIIYRQSIDEYAAQGFKTHPQIEYLEKNFTQESIQEFDDLRLYLFVKRSP